MQAHRTVAEGDDVGATIRIPADYLEDMRTALVAVTDVAQYGPINVGAVLDVAAQLRWAAAEAIRIDPGLDDRPAADDPQRGSPPGPAVRTLVPPVA